MCMDIFISDRKKHHNNTNELKWKGGKTFTVYTYKLFTQVW